MAFQLKARESVGQGIPRVVTRELAAVLDRTRSSPDDPGTATDTIHQIRKGLKRVRAALRLVRDGLGTELYHQENFRLRDAARPLAILRDAQMLPEAWALLCHEFPQEIEPATVKTVRDALAANEKEVTRRLLTQDRVLARVGSAVDETLADVARWKLTQEAWTELEGGLRRVYRAGRRSRALATNTRTVEDLHEWRKQAKYLWHALELVEPAWRGHDKGLDDRFHELSTLLGRDHDLAVLRRTLAADPLPFGGHRVLKTIFALVERRRQGLEAAAFTLGGPLYEETPGAWASRVLGITKAPAAKAAARTAG
jgi:CHAD domain-containing protein